MGGYLKDKKNPGYSKKRKMSLIVLLMGLGCNCNQDDGLRLHLLYKTFWVFSIYVNNIPPNGIYLQNLLVVPPYWNRKEL